MLPRPLKHSKKFRRDLSSARDDYGCHNTPGDVNITVVPSAHISPVGSNQISLKHGVPVFLTLSVKQISTSDTSKEQVELVAANDASFKSAVIFNIAGSPDAKLPPPTMPCGTINENSFAIAVSDDPGRADKRFDAKSDVTLVDGQTAMPGLFSEYTNNGGGQAKLGNASVNCSQINSQKTIASKSIAIRADLWAKAGHCCSGRNPGGVVNFSPEWTSTFQLPGAIGHNRWTVRLDSSVVKSGSKARCEWSLNGVKQSDLSASGNSTNSVAVAPGSHAVKVSCTADDFHVDARPGGGWDHEASAKDTVNLVWTLSRTDQ
jgi:hypothetical protein